MKVLKVLLETDVYGEPVSIRHVNLLHEKTTADDDTAYRRNYDALHPLRFLVAAVLGPKCTSELGPCTFWS